MRASMANRAVPSSDSVTYGLAYDVFLSFRGEDTRSGFTGHLYNSLRNKGINAFIDDEALRRGEEITPSLFKAIQESRIAIIVFSENYASSTFCLNELAKIIECFKGQLRPVFPVFYHVDPSDIRHQRGSYGQALNQHQEKLKDDWKVQQWRLALIAAANLSGWHIERGKGYEYEFVENIIDGVSAKINRVPLHVTEYPIGLVSRVQEVVSLLNLWSSEEVHMVGICGIGGIGKSTIARSLYNSIADHFKDSCFLSNVREISNKQGLSHLQETLLSELVKEKDLKLGDVHIGISTIKQRLHGKKVLLILDDVDNLKQLQALAGRCDWFGFGSRIIITTRNKHLLVRHGVERIYNVKELNDDEAFQLFNWNAFKKSNVDSSYMDISNRAMHCSRGLPLALEVIGSNLCGKTIAESSSALDKYQKIPNKEVQEVLKISYDGLEDDEKEIFLDLACFFVGNPLGYVIDMLQSTRDIQSEHAIGVLKDKCLIKISYDYVIIMHDSIQDMGKEIVRQESSKYPGSRSRLWFCEDILQVLQENTGTKKIEAIILDFPQCKEVRWNGMAFKKMKNLRILIIRNASFSRGPNYLPNSLRVLKWSGYPSEFLPSGFHPARLVHLDLYNNCYESLKSLIKNLDLERLKSMNFSKCKFLREVPDLSEAPNLTNLHFDDCSSLTKIHDSVGLLDKIREFSAERCLKLRTIPQCIKWRSLEYLGLSRSSSLQNFPEILVTVENLTKLYLSGTAIKELPSSICNLVGLEILLLDDCKCLEQLPTSISMFPKLWILNALSCSELRYFKKCEGEKQLSPVVTCVNFSECNLSNDTLPLCLSAFQYVSFLNLSFNNFTILPACLKKCHFLKELHLNSCKRLRQIEGIPPNLEVCDARNCTSLTSLSSSFSLDQALQGQLRDRLILPGQRIPEWFDYYNEGELLSFWVRKKFPTIIVCFVFDVSADLHGIDNLEFSLRINGFNEMDLQNFVSLSTIIGHHVFLGDIQNTFLDVTLSEVDNEWNHVELKLTGVNGGIKSIGVHVHKKPKNSMKNIRFTNPNSSKRMSHYSWNSNSNGVLKKQRTFGNCVADKHKEDSDYRQIIPLKMVTMETRSQYGTVQQNGARDLGATQSNQAINQGESSACAQAGQSSGGDWQEEVYQKIKIMKEAYLPELNEIYKKIFAKLQQRESFPQQSRSEKLEKLIVFKMMLERIISLLQNSKRNILPWFKEKLGSYEKQIINFINTNRPSEAMSSPQPGHLPPPLSSF